MYNSVIFMMAAVCILMLWSKLDTSRADNRALQAELIAIEEGAECFKLNPPKMEE